MNKVSRNIILLTLLLLLSGFVSSSESLETKVKQDCETFKKLRSETHGWVKDPELWLRVLITCPDRRTRSTAAIDLQHWVTDNGQKTCTGLTVLEENLNSLLKALKDGATSQHIVDVLGGRWSGGTPLPCCMKPENKQKVIHSLEDLKTNLPKDLYYWSSSIPIKALKNIDDCR